jgi:hypothetical protein
MSHLSAILISTPGSPLPPLLHESS